MARIPRKQWNDLTEKEKEILKAIGITPEKPKAPKQRVAMVKAPEPHTLEITINCQLCRSVSYQYFDMVLSNTDQEPHLHAVAISKKEALKRERLTKKNTNPGSCKMCFDTLHNYTKEELIKKLIRVYPLSLARK